MGHVLVIGGGASGMMAALFAARAGASVTLLEHNEKLGKKVYITGKGRCNLTNDCSLEEFLTQVPRNPRFLFSALSFFGPREMMSLLESTGCPVTVQRGRRVFPASEKASDVTRTLSRLLDQAGVCVSLRTEVASLAAEAGRLRGVILSDGSFLPADAVILATGGLSYPATGSTGDGYRLARECGHTVLSPRPVLVGLETREAWPRDLQGLSLKNVRLRVAVQPAVSSKPPASPEPRSEAGKKARKAPLFDELGELLFTHYGVSGPLALEASCHLPEESENVSLLLDLKPGLTPEQLDARLLRELGTAGKKQVGSMLETLLPSRLARLFPSLCGLSAALPCSQVAAGQRLLIRDRLKALPLTLKAPRPLAEAVVTRGGVSVTEVSPATMESRLMPGLFLAGELLDVDAHTGGYNLQIAWATGALAGQRAAERV